MRLERPAFLAAWLSLALFLSAPAARGADAPQWKGAAPNSGDSFRFVVMGDNTGTPAPDEWEEAVREVNLLKPDFVMSVGDFIPGYAGDTAALAKMWDEFDAKNRKLDAPFYYCAGNHDISNPMMREFWLARYGVAGRSCYSFDRGGCHFVVLDTVTQLFAPDFAKEQLAWLKQDLAAARDAKHVFVFYHEPQMQNKAVWPELVKLFPAGKTTVFNGHIHDLSYGEPDGVPVYVLGSTGAEIRTDDKEPNRVFGKFRMFAHVAVDNGTPAVALLPLHEVLPGNLVSMAFTDAFTASFWPKATRLSQKGGALAHTYHNALSAPLRVSTSWNAPGWNVRPPVAAVTIPPGGDGELKFDLRPRDDNPDFPRYTASFETTDPSGKKASLSSSRMAWFFNELDIPAVRSISVDGDPGDWRRVKPCELKYRSRVQSGVDNWSGEKDSSARIRLGHDGRRLYACVEVTDDQVSIDDKDWGLSDAVQFFWDGRPADRQDGKHGIGTGQLVLPVPPEGQAPAPVWQMGDRPVPKGLVAAMKPTAGGYVCEFSLPLAELGVTPPLAAGQGFNVEFKVDDRDIVDGKPVFSSMDISGRRGNAQVTTYYARCRFR